MKTVLVIEADGTLEKKVKRVLPGVDLVFADSERSVALEATRSRPHVILMDVSLPGEDGFRICQRLQLQRVTRDIPILFLASDADSLADFGPDADAVVAPDDFDTLKERIAALSSEFAMRRAFREAFASVSATLPEGFTDLTQVEREVLASGGLPVDATIDPRPIAQRTAQYDAILASSLTTARAARKLGVNASRVRQRLLARPAGLYGLRKGNSWRLPRFQFGRKGLVPNIERVIVKLDPALDPVAVVGWFNRSNTDLEQDDGHCSPLDWLAQGKSWEMVATLAEDL